MRVLVLYWNPAGQRMRHAVRRHLATLVSSGGASRTVAYNAVGGAPQFLERFDPDAVILHNTFLAARWIAPFERWRMRSSWIGRLGVPVLAFPQDDYERPDVLDEWLAELGATDVFTSLPDAVSELYRRRAGGAVFHRVLTGYLDTETVRVANSVATPIAARRLHVVYRATALPYWFGSYGQLKRAIGDESSERIGRLALEGDVSTEADDVISGDRWLTFLASGRLVVGCESGASAIDRRGELRERIERVLSERPGATFDQVSAGLPAGWDDHRLLALSPRHLEAAATRTAQVLVSGAYSGVLEPERHYIPVSRDLSDLGPALETAREPSILQHLADRTYEEIVHSGVASSSLLADQVAEVLRDHGLEERTRGTGSRVAFYVTKPLAEAASSTLAWRKPGAALGRFAPAARYRS